MRNCKTSDSNAITAPSTLSPYRLIPACSAWAGGRAPPLLPGAPPGRAGGREGRLLSPPVATCRPATCRRLLPPFHSAIPHSIPHSRRLELIVFRKFLWCQQRAILELSAAPPPLLPSSSPSLSSSSSSPPLFYSFTPLSLHPSSPKFYFHFFPLFLKKNRLNSFCFHFLLFTFPLLFHSRPTESAWWPNCPLTVGSSG